MYSEHVDCTTRALVFVTAIDWLLSTRQLNIKTISICAEARLTVGLNLRTADNNLCKEICAVLFCYITNGSLFCTGHTLVLTIELRH